MDMADSMVDSYNYIDIVGKVVVVDMVGSMLDCYNIFDYLAKMVHWWLRPPQVLEAIFFLHDYYKTFDNALLIPPLI